MKLSETMLNFLGNTVESIDWRNSNFSDTQVTVAMITHFGVVAALKNNLIQPATYTLEVPKNDHPIPGVPYGRVYDGYSLTERGIKLGRIGKILRRHSPVHNFLWNCHRNVYEDWYKQERQEIVIWGQHVLDELTS